MAQGTPSPLEWGPGLGPQALGGATRRAAAQPLGEGRAVRIWSVELFTPSHHRVRCHCAWPPCQPLTTSTLMLAQHRHSPTTRGPEAGGLVSGRLLPQPVGGTGEPRARPWTLLSWAAPVPRAGVLWSAVGWDHEEGLQNAHPAWLGWHGGHVTPTFNSGTRAERLQTLSATVTLGRKLLPGPGPPRIREARGAWGGCGSAEPPQLKVIGETRAPSSWGGHPGGLQGRAGPGAHGREPGTADMQG